MKPMPPTISLKEGSKNQLRQRYLALRKAVSRSEWSRRSEVISRLIFEWVIPKNYKQIFLYISHNQEPELRVLIEQLSSSKMRLALPVLLSEDAQMEFHYWQLGEPFKSNKFGILEPRATPRTLAVANPDTLIIMPSLALDTAGNRLGYGKGYYDRYLGAQRNGAQLMGVVFRECLSSRLPSERFDIPADFIATDGGISARP